MTRTREHDSSTRRRIAAVLRDSGTPTGTRDRLGYVSLVWLTIVYVLVGGPVGILAGLVLAAVWVGTGVLATVAVAHLLVVGLAVEPVAPVFLAGLETGVGGLFLGRLPASPAPGSRSPARAALVVVGSCSVAAGLFAASYHWLSALWQVAVVLACSAALGAYVIHRYERVRLGLVPVEGETA